VSVQSKLQEAIALHQRGHLEQAQRLYAEILSEEPRHFKALHLFGVIAAQTGNPAQALHYINQALQVNPQDASAHHGQAAALQELQRPDEALAGYGRAIAIQPEFLRAYLDRGSLLQEHQQFDAALSDFDRAVALKPNDADIHLSRGAVLVELRRWEAALAALNRAIALDAKFAEAYANRAAVLEEIGKWEAAKADYDRAVTLRPDFGFLLGHSAHLAAQLCDWRDQEAVVADLSARIARDEPACAPFPFLSLSVSAPLQRRCAEIWMRRRCPPQATLGPIDHRGRHERIRVGYFSPDFREHAVSYLTAELFETHDRSKFEVTGFSLGVDTQDPMRKRLERGFERFMDVRQGSDRDVAMLARRLEIDIAVDLAGFTKGARPKIFALRAAPLQVSYLGFLGTMAAPYMDYLVADEVVVPPENRVDYSEQLLYLPSYQVNDSRRVGSEGIVTRQELRLPPEAFVFCCFNASYKISPQTFASWMRILLRVPGSVLFLLKENDTMMTNLKKEAAARGVDAQRLIFGERLAVSLYLARYQSCDLFLDTLPYNAGTTGSDALWVGLPVLTCRGNTFAGRVGASLLSALGLPELIAKNQAQYEESAVKLALHPVHLAKLKQQLARQRTSARLFDTRRFTQHLEAAYTRIYERHQAGLPPRTD
jgi:predicted O-linked N-acetylglucosamine transferase (SPINDLY family)